SFLMSRRLPPLSPPFPYTTLFRAESYDATHCTGSYKEISKCVTDISRCIQKTSWVCIRISTSCREYASDCKRITYALSRVKQGFALRRDYFTRTRKTERTVWCCYNNIYIGREAAWSYSDDGRRNRSYGKRAAN